MKKKREEVENDPSPVKRITIEKSPLNKSRFPPISKVNSSVDRGSPIKKYYEESPFTSKRSVLDNDDNFTKQIISLKNASIQDYSDGPYAGNTLLGNKTGVKLWQSHREKKIILNRSQEQLQRSVQKWGENKSFHHERSLMVADRHKIAYNDH